MMTLTIHPAREPHPHELIVTFDGGGESVLVHGWIVCAWLSTGEAVRRHVLAELTAGRSVTLEVALKGGGSDE